MKRAAYVAVILLVGCLAAQPLSAYIIQKGIAQDGSTVNLRWDPSAFPLPWQLNPTQGSNITGSRSLASVVQQSFQSWASVSTAKVSFTQKADTAPSAKAAYDGVNLVTTNVSTSDWAAYGGGSSVLAFTTTSWFDVGGVVDVLNRPVNFAGQVLEADIIFNPAFAFSTETSVPSDHVDFQAVLTHEIGHFLGLDHTNLLSSTMFWTTSAGVAYPRNLSSDEVAGISSLYPTAAFSASGTMSGTVRFTSNQAVFGALVVVVNSSGLPVASAITDANGKYTIAGLASGSYTVFAEPLDGPLTEGNVYTLLRLDPKSTMNTNFTTRFR